MTHQISQKERIKSRNVVNNHHNQNIVDFRYEISSSNNVYRTEVPKKWGGQALLFMKPKPFYKCSREIPATVYQRCLLHFNLKVLFLYPIKVLWKVSYFCKYWHFSDSPRLNQCVSPLKMLHSMDNGCSTSEHKIANIKSCKYIVSLPNAKISICYKNLAISILSLI